MIVQIFKTIYYSKVEKINNYSKGLFLTYMFNFMTKRQTLKSSSPNIQERNRTSKDQRRLNL